MSEYVIETKALTRYYGKRCVVRDLHLRVPRGSIYGFLGLNGAGKSTTIRMLMGLASPTRGSATVLGQDCTRLTPETRARVGYLAEGHNVYGWMTVAECGRFQKSYYEHWNDDIFNGVIEHFGLDLKAHGKDLSRGERAGLCLAMVLAPEPELLILDDPALGLDAAARVSLLQSMLFVTQRSDRTILFSSHLLADVERVADRIAILDKGVLRADCTIETFRQNVRQFALRFKGKPPSVSEIPGLLRAFPNDDCLLVTMVGNDAIGTAGALERLAPLEIAEVPFNLEDAFVAYVAGNRGKGFFAGRREVSQ